MSWSEERLVFQAKEYYSSLVQDISKATQSVDLEAYIFDEDPVGEQVSEALISAAKRGVSVRVLVDGIGSLLWGSAMTDRMEAVGIQTRVYHPLPWNFWQYTRSRLKGFWISRFIRLLTHINRRNHRKVTLIDSKIAWVGSFNISSTHFTKRDAAIRVLGPPLTLLTYLFEVNWSGLNRRKVRKKIHSLFQRFPLQNLPIRANATFKLRRYFYRELLLRIENSSKHIWIANAYFIPDLALIRALQRAALRGVDVSLILPGYSDVFFLPWSTAHFYGELLKAGVKIFELKPGYGYLHEKSLIIDDWLQIGSSNLNHRSLFSDLEIDICSSHPNSLETMKKHFQDYQKEATQVVDEKVSLVGPLKRRIGRILLLFKYWM